MKSLALSLTVALVLPFTLCSAATGCAHSCSGHGRCDAYRSCTCAEGYTGADCSQRICPYGPAWADPVSSFTASDQGHALAECSNRGLCDRDSGLCRCQSDLQGKACERRSCQNDCNGFGMCISLEFFATLADPGAGTVYSYQKAWDAQMMHGCYCYPEQNLFYGHDCSQRACPLGDDPLTTNQINEEQQITCEATAGSATLSFRGFSTRQIAWDATIDDLREALLELPSFTGQDGNQRIFRDEPALLPAPLSAQLDKGTIGLEFLQASSSWCNEPAVQTRIIFHQDFGDQPMIVADTTHLERISPPGTPGLISIAEVHPGTTENEFCSNRGLCNRVSGNCECDQDLWTSSDGYGQGGSRGDCGMATSIIIDCPGELACSGHGTCSGSPQYRCDCQTGWTGADCSEMICPQGKSWFSRPTYTDTAHERYAECSDMGICETSTGSCTCASGFAGSACEYTICPTSITLGECSGHGQCLTMSQLAQAAGFEYGINPNDPYTWDHDMVRGCHCDAGFDGYDCSLRTCSYGDDPITPSIESRECSGRGICDQSTGQCDCFDGFGASDGNGNKGTVDDCGYILPFQSSSADETNEIASDAFAGLLSTL